MMATTALPANLSTVSDDDLILLVATVADDEDALGLVLAELDRRDDDEPEPTEEQRRADLIAQNRLPGETLDQCVDRMYGEHTALRFDEASEECRGRLLNREYEGRRDLAIDPYSLFHGPARAAAKYASTELMDWWKANGRQTWIEYKFAMLGRPGDAAAAARAARATQDWIR